MSSVSDPIGTAFHGLADLRRGVAGRARPMRREDGGAARPSHWARQLHVRGALVPAQDLALAVSVYLLSYWLRFHFQLLAVKFVAPPALFDHLIGGTLFALTWVILNWREGVYSITFPMSPTAFEEARMLGRNAAMAVAAMMVVAYLYRPLLLSRQVYLMTGVLGWALLLLVRAGMRAVERRLPDEAPARERCLVVGEGAEATLLKRQIGGRYGRRSVLRGGTVAETDSRGQPQGPFLARVLRLHENPGFSSLAIAETEWLRLREGAGRRTCMEVLNSCEKHGIGFYLLPSLLEVSVDRRELGSFAGLPMIRIRDASEHPAFRAVKAVFDRTVAFLVLVCGLPLWLLVAAVIKLTSKGPVFFRQQRAGLHGRPFVIYKFRTMAADAEQQLRKLVDIEALRTPGFKIRNDPRVTRVGRLLRSTSLDEIPQLLNVLKGEMSLVGPRPEMLDLVERYTPEQRRRLKALPGITGYQQVMARGIPLSEGVHYDLLYLKRQGVLMDTYVLLKTVAVVLSRRGITT